MGQILHEIKEERSLGFGWGASHSPGKWCWYDTLTTRHHNVRNKAAVSFYRYNFLIQQVLCIHHIMVCCKIFVIYIFVIYLKVRYTN